jgi:hypothetical protein
MHPKLLQKARREAIRWHLLSIANISRPEGINTSAMLPVIQGVYPDATHSEIRCEIDYLAERDLVTIKQDPLDSWVVKLTRYGIDVVEYTVDVEPGINRPLLSQV